VALCLCVNLHPLRRGARAVASDSRLPDWGQISITQMATAKVARPPFVHRMMVCAQGGDTDLRNSEF
jgi:hypothetical protein